MNGHFSIVNKKGAVIASMLIGLSIIVFATSLGHFIANRTLFLLLPVIVFAVGFLVGIMVLVSILTAGIDIRDGIVIMPDLDPAKGKQPKFNIKDLDKVDLCDGDGAVLHPDSDSLRGARIVFLLKDGSFEKYYPVSITPEQFKKIQKGMMEMAEHAR